MRILKLNLLAGLVLVTVLLAGCKSTRNTAVRTDVAGTVATRSCVENLTGRNAGADGMEARMRFSLRVGDKDLSVGGNLRMKKDRIIQLQLIGLGIIEGGRIEFTPDSVLLVDRLNRRYISSGYDGIEFLRNAQIDFYTFCIGHEQPNDADRSRAEQSLDRRGGRRRLRIEREQIRARHFGKGDQSIRFRRRRNG